MNAKQAKRKMQAAKDIKKSKKTYWNIQYLMLYAKCIRNINRGCKHRVSYCCVSFYWYNFEAGRDVASTLKLMGYKIYNSCSAPFSIKKHEILISWDEHDSIS